jgi:hypothetical protein
MTLKACVLCDPLDIITMTIGTIPDPVRVFPLVVALVTIYSGFFMGLMDDIHLILPALGSHDHGQLGQFSWTLFLAGNK